MNAGFMGSDKKLVAGSRLADNQWVPQLFPDPKWQVSKRISSPSNAMNVDRGGGARAEGIERFRLPARFVVATISQAAKRRPDQICQPGFPNANGGCLDDVEEMAAVRIRQAVNELISTAATG